MANMIKFFREQAKMTQPRFAELMAKELGVEKYARTKVSMIETEYMLPSQVEVEAAARVLGKTPADLFNNDLLRIIYERDTTKRVKGEA